MSDSRYWDSLRQAGLFIYLFLFLLFLGLAGLGYFADRIGALEIWDSPVWVKIKVPLIAVGVIGFVGGVIAFARYGGQKELQAAQQYAQARGWGFARDDTEGLTARAAEILWALKNISIHYVRTVETGRRSLYLFNCWYKYEKETASRPYSYGTAGMIRFKRFASAGVPLDIVQRDWTEVMESDKVDMGKSRFSEQFLVLSRDPAGARETVSAAIQEIMLEHLTKPLHNPVSVSFGPGGVVAMTDRTNDPERLQDLIELLRAIESAAR